MPSKVCPSVTRADGLSIANLEGASRAGMVRGKERRRKAAPLHPLGSYHVGRVLVHAGRPQTSLGPVFVFIVWLLPGRRRPANVIHGTSANTRCDALARVGQPDRRGRPARLEHARVQSRSTMCGTCSPCSRARPPKASSRTSCPVHDADLTAHCWAYRQAAAGGLPRRSPFLPPSWSWRSVGFFTP